MNKLILGDIDINTINDRKLLELELSADEFDSNGLIVLTSNELGNISNPIFLNCWYENELIYPDIKWDEENNILTLIFGFQLKNKIIINFNIKEKI